MNSPRTKRVLQILNFVVLRREPVKLKEIGDEFGLHPSMVSRIVADLVSGGLLSRSTYRSVIASPALAMLGKRAGENHPITRIAGELLPAPLERMGLYGALSALEMDSFYHFFLKWEHLPLTETIWRSDLAAVIFSSMPEQETESELLRLLPEGHERERDLFRERIAEAGNKRYLVNFHSGRFWQLTFPLECGSLHCALSVAKQERPENDSVFFECSRLVSKIRNSYGNWKNSLC